MHDCGALESRQGMRFASLLVVQSIDFGYSTVFEILQGAHTIQPCVLKIKQVTCNIRAYRARPHPQVKL